MDQKEPKWKMKNLKSVQDRGNYGNELKLGLCTEVVVRRCSVKKCSYKFRKIHRKTPVPDSHF